MQRKFIVYSCNSVTTILYYLCCSYAVEFEWGEEKNWSNADKHGLRFERAALVF